MNKGYPTNLTDNQCQILQKILEPTTRKRKYSLRDIMDTLREKLRVLLGKEESPSLGIIDSRSAKTTQHVDKERGIDGNKKIKGRKDQVVVDTLGFPMAVSVHEASIHDSKSAESALGKLAHKFPRLKKILADGGYRGDKLKEAVRKTLGCQFEVVLRPDESVVMKKYFGAFHSKI